MSGFGKLNDGDKRVVLKKIDVNYVKLISPYEQIFSLLGVKIIPENGNEILDPSEFRRIGNVKVKRASIRKDIEGGKSIIHLALPEDSKGETVESFFKDQQNTDIAYIVDNPFSIVKYVDCLKRASGSLDPIYIDYSDKKTPIVFDPTDDFIEEETIDASRSRSFDDPPLKNGSTQPAYTRGYIPGMIPMHFVWGCGYRSLAYCVAVAKCRYNKKDTNQTFNSEDAVDEKDFNEQYLQTKLKALSRFKDFFTTNYTECFQYKCVSFYDISKDQKEGDRDYLASKIDIYSSVAEYGVSTWSHVYADVLTRAIYDTYNTFGMTHSNIDSAATSLHGFKIALAAFYISPSFAVKTIADNGMCFPSEERLVTYSMKDREYQIPEDNEIKGYEKSRIRRHIGRVDDNLQKFANDRNPMREAISNAAVEDTGFNKTKLGKMMDSVIGLYEVGRYFELDDSEGYVSQRAEFVDFLKTFQGFTTIFLVDSSKLISDSIPHAMNVSGMFDNVKNGKSRNDLLALPGFFLQYLYEEGYIKAVNITAACVFSKKTRLMIVGGPGSLERKGLRLLKNITDFATAPFMALYERMYSVYHLNCIYSEWLSRIPRSTKLNVAYNHAAKEGVVFTSKDTFSNSGKQIIEMIKEEKKKRRIMQYTHYYAVEIKGPRNAEVEFFKDGDIENGAIKEHRAGELINELQDAIDTSVSIDARTFMFPYDEEPVTRG